MLFLNQLRISAVGLASIGLVVGCQNYATTPAAPTATPSASTIPVIEIDAADFLFSAPDTVSSGFVTLHMTNHGQESHHGQLLRLNDGVALDSFLDTLQRGDQQAATAMVSIEGGPGLIDPHGATDVTLNLIPGTYVLACFVPSEDGVPHLAKGMLKPIQVVPSNTSTMEPRSVASITAKDFTFEIPAELPSGRATYRVSNAARSRMRSKSSNSPVAPQSTTCSRSTANRVALRRFSRLAESMAWALENPAF